MYTEDQVDILELGRATQRLYDNKDFCRVILEGFIDKQGLGIAKNFDGSESDVDTLKSITLLNDYLTSKVEDSKIVLQHSNKGV